MKLYHRILLHCVVIFAVSACQTQRANTDQSMTLEDCRKSTICTIEGALSVHLINHVKMGRITLESGDCIGVSLAEEEIVRLEKGAPAIGQVTGRVMPGLHSETLQWLEVIGRRVGLAQCQDFYIFVD